MDPYIGSKIVKSRQADLRASSAREYMARECLLPWMVSRRADIDCARVPGG